MEKKINYLARDFEDIKSELIDFSKKYYPEISDNFNDSSVGSWFIDLVSAVGDNLSYHTDRMYQENNINSASLKSSIYNNARMNGIRIPGPKSSMCEVELSCILPIDDNDGNKPKWSSAPIVKMGSVFGNTSYQFELFDDVNFGHQFNEDGFSDRKYSPLRDNNGIITGYSVTKTAIVIGGKNKIYKKLLTDDDIRPFMEVVLPEKDIMNVESVIFKESSNFNGEPQSYEYYVDSEEYLFNGQSISTYRFFEVDSLSDQFIFGRKVNVNGDGKIAPYSVHSYNDIDGVRYYNGEWKPITQKFVTEYTDNGYLKIIFGCGNSPSNLNDGNDYTQYAKYMLSKVMNNDLLGVLPKAGWTMYVLYRSSGGISTNLAPGSINTVMNANITFINAVNDSEKNEISKSLSVINRSPSVGGKDFPSLQELKYFVKYASSEQKRCVTLKDYKSRVMMIPSRYGCPFRCNAIDDNNKVLIPCLGLRSDGKLDDSLSEILVKNIKEYLSHYKSLGDYIELRSGKIYNISFILDIFIDKNYIPSDVVKNVIDSVYSYMDVNNHDMGEDIVIGDLERKINTIDGVIGLINLSVYSCYNGDGYNDKSILPEKIGYDENCLPIKNDFKNGKCDSFQIDLDKIDNVLSCEYDSMFEILDKSTDIVVRTKIR